MAKSFKKATEGAQDIYSQIAKGGAAKATTDTADRVDAKDTRDTQDTENAKTEYYRFNLKMPMEYKDYLQAAAYKASSPTKTVTITEYICKLIAEDMERSK